MGSHSKQHVKKSSKNVKENAIKRIEKASKENQEHEIDIFDVLKVLTSAIILIAAMVVPSKGIVKLLAFAIPCFICGYDVFLRAIDRIVHAEIFDESFLMSIATIGAFAIGKYSEGTAIMLFFKIGELIEGFAESRSRNKISELTELRPDYANVETFDGLTRIDPSEVRIGGCIVVLPGERIPLDGKIISGSTNIDASSLTGESVPVFVDKGDEVLSGCVNISSPIKVCVTNDYSDSTASRILKLIEESVENKSKQESFIHRFSRIYTPVVVLIAVFLAIVPSLVSGNWVDWIRRALTFLVVSCPCALIVSVPLAYFAGIGNASQNGILIKGSNYLEALSKAEVFVFDKTGTITEGKYSVSEIYPEGVSKETLLNFAAKAESYSNHPLAKAIVASADRDFLKVSIASGYEEYPGRGIKALVNGAKVYVGKAEFILEKCEGVKIPEQGGTNVFVSINGKYRGCISLTDSIKDGAFDALERLRSNKAQKLVLLTGDVQNISRRVASSLNFDLVKSELLPEDKVSSVEYLIKNKNAGSTLVFIGDGVNDAPVLARADVGIAMGAMGSDAAIEAADVVIMDDSIQKVATAVDIADFTTSVSKQNIILSITAKIIILILGVFGIAGVWAAVFGDVGVLLITVINSLRALYKKY